MSWFGGSKSFLLLSSIFNRGICVGGLLTGFSSMHPNCRQLPERSAAIGNAERAPRLRMAPISFVLVPVLHSKQQVCADFGL